MKTPLFNLHLDAGGKLIEFAGWQLPVQFKGIREEHLHVRSKAGLFDVSHMGEIRIKGKNALKTLQYLTTNDVQTLTAGKAQYSLLLNEKGGVVDDIVIYCLSPNEDYLVCVNAANQKKDLEWFLAHNQGALIENQSPQWAQIALQGPMAPQILLKVVQNPELLKKLQFFHFYEDQWNRHQMIVARTGYTGEWGYEIFLPWDDAPSLWEALLSESEDLWPIGLGARDTLRLEMGYSLYGQDLTDDITPYEAGLNWVVKENQKDFIGKTALRPPYRSRVGFLLLERGIPRTGYSLFSFDKKEIGKVTSGTFSPSLERPIGLGLVDSSFAKKGEKFFVKIRQRFLEAEVVSIPFVEPRAQKPIHF